MASKTTTSRVVCGVVGDDGGRKLAVWRGVNIALAALAVAAVAWLAVRAATPRPLDRQDDSDVAAVPADPPAQPPSLDFRQVLSSRRLFVQAMPAPPGPDLADALEKARARLSLHGIVQVRERLGAYFEVRPPAGVVALPPARMSRAPVRPNARPRAPLGLYFEGDTVGDFVVKKIETRSVVLTLAGQDVTFSI